MQGAAWGIGNGGHALPVAQSAAEVERLAPSFHPSTQKARLTGWAWLFER